MLLNLQNINHFMRNSGHCDFFVQTSAVDKISTDIVCRAVPLR